jgi:hypothetical protein
MGYVTDPDRGVEKKDAGVKVPLKQGARKARPEGGVGPAGLGEPDFQAEDRQNQSAAALLKLRLHMTGREWGEHRRGVQANVPATAAAFDQAETMFADYYVRIARGLLGPDAMPLDPRSDDAMAKAGTKLLEGLARRKVHGAEAKESEAHDPAVMNALMSVSNREVERLLTEQVYKLRREVEGLIKQQDRLSPSRQAEKLALESDINARLVELRLVGAKVQSFANEAYFTDAGLQHAVVGMQAEQGIQLTKADGMNVVIENMGDALKELGHYEDANEALYKAAKYMLRLADAAMNMGYGYIGAVRRLYDVGRSAAVDIKNRKPAEEAGESKAAQTAAEAAPLFGGHWPVPRATPDVQLSRAELRAAVIEAGTLVEKEYHLELRARLPEEKEREVAARGAATAETPGRPTLKKADYASASAAAGHPRLEPLDPTHPRDAPEAKAGEAKRTQEAVKALGELESLPS